MNVLDFSPVASMRPIREFPGSLAAAETKSCRPDGEDPPVFCFSTDIDSAYRQDVRKFVLNPVQLWHHPFGQQEVELAYLIATRRPRLRA